MEHIEPMAANLGKPTKEQAEEAVQILHALGVKIAVAEFVPITDSWIVLVKPEDSMGAYYRYKLVMKSRLDLIQSSQ